MAGRTFRARRLAVALLAAFAMASRSAAGATIVVNNLDGPGEGLNDSTPVLPVGGNNGATRGAQRLNAFQAAANIWGGLLDSSITIRADTTMDPLSCTADSAVLGTAGPNGVAKDYVGAPLSNHWYAVALANSLAHQDLNTTAAEIHVTFNSNLGAPNCFNGAGWYLGLDGNHGNLTDLVAVAVHELGHGLGFVTFVTLTSGANLSGIPDAYEHVMLDIGTGVHWDVMSDAQRVTSAQHTRFVAWDGPLVTAGVPQNLTAGSPVLAISSPPSLQGEYIISTASFGPPFAQSPASGAVKLAQDSGGASSTDGCEPIVNGLSGKIGLVDRGTCGFTVKVHNAQNAGAIAVLIADNVAGSPPGDLLGSDPGITIPSALITMSDGTAFKNALLSNTVNVSLSVDATRYLGSDAQHRLLIHTPQPSLSGSSLTHWDPIASPNLLMEPIITADQNHGVDLTLRALQDLGWHSAAAQVPATPGVWALLSAFAVAGAGLVALRRSRGGAS
jgi:PA domain